MLRGYKITIRLLLLVSIISLSLITFLSSFFSYLYNSDYYEQKYQQYKVYEKIPKELALNETKTLLNYFRSENELDKQFFNEMEVNHLYDVKTIINKIQIVYQTSLLLLCGTLIFIYLWNKKTIKIFITKTSFYSGLITLSLICLSLVLYFNTGFDYLFQKFHEVFFTGNYLFDPTTSNLKTLFPDQFFADLSFSIIFSTSIKAVLLMIVSYFLEKILYKPSASHS